MKHLTIAGLQWGDEGKGKMVDVLADRFDVIIRFQGGHNAGHTLNIDGKIYKLSLLPSGIVRGDKICVIGNGVVLDPSALSKEIALMRTAGIAISKERLKIADNVALILPLHSYIEKMRGQTDKIGTTARGIGPAYEDKIARRNIKLFDLHDTDNLKDKVDRLVEFHNFWLKGAGHDGIDAHEIYQYLLTYRDLLLEFSTNLWSFLERAHTQGKGFLFEGAQGALLDIDHGTYPYVTSSNTVASAAAMGSGITVDNLKLGIIKAYCTRVGHGIFPSEDFGNDGKILSERGKEFGTVTGRARRCGWLDIPLLRQAINVSGIDVLALTKIDVLDEFDSIKICTHYQIDGKDYHYLPYEFIEKPEGSLQPIYQQIQGWKQPLNQFDSIDDFPDAAKNFISVVEKLAGKKIVMVSTGPERKDIFYREDFLTHQD